MKKTQKLTLVAILSALAIVFTLIKIPYPPTPYLEFDLGDMVELFAVSTVGLYGAVIVAFIKTGIQLISGSVSPYNIGEVMALTSALSYAITFYLTRKFNIIVRLVIVALVATSVMVVFNFYFATPVYTTGTLNYNNAVESLGGGSITNYLKFILITYIPFNLLKASMICTIYLLTERPILKAFNSIFKK